MNDAWRRSSGILLHPGSLPGPHGIGELGKHAHRFLDFLEAAGQRLWQVLPLGPTGYGDSPYACFSSFAGNPLLISLDSLVDRGLLSDEELIDMPSFVPTAVDYGALIEWKMPHLRRAASRFLESGSREKLADFQAFTVREASWLEDYSLFMAIKEAFEAQALARGEPGGAWNVLWDRDIALRDAGAVQRRKRDLSGEIHVVQIIQYFFFTQWDSLHRAANEKGIRIVGDLPIFVAQDSADVWANRELFLLDDSGKPTRVAGVPPDYFAATGQLWGNPLYDWEAHARQGFAFWISRIKAALRLYDYVRIDHFRGFDACWAVPSGDRTAEHGAWEKAPGYALFETLEAELGTLPLIAEDLGFITGDVDALRARFGLPGMRILQFAFDAGEGDGLSSGNRFLPHNHTADSVVYTGTHDNDTTAGWFAGRTAGEIAYLERYDPSGESNITWRLIRMAMASVSRFAVIPMQDLLGLGTQARMNTPGTSGGNWAWRFEDGAPGDALAKRLRDLSMLYGRTE